jgi:hypothetical protein
MNYFDERKKSFIKNGWNQSIAVNIDELCEAGFYYYGYKDEVKCFHCGLNIYVWVEGDHPWITHAMYRPKCHFLKSNKSAEFIEKHRIICQKENSDYLKERVRCELVSERLILMIIIVISIYIFKTRKSSLPNINACVFDKCSDIQRASYECKITCLLDSMNLIDERKKSFIENDWDQSIAVSVDELCEAGFYYYGYENVVKCFQCGLEVYNWVEEDQPWFRHAKYNPNCPFLKFNKNNEFIETYQQDYLKASFKRLEDRIRNDLVSQLIYTIVNKVKI